MAKRLNNQILAAAMSRSAGIEASALEAVGVHQDVLHEVESQRLDTIGFHGICRIVSASMGAGHAISNNAGPIDIGNRFFELLASGGHLAAGESSSLSLRMIMDDAINRTISARFDAFPSIIPQVAKIVDQKDFRPWHNYTVSGGGFLKKLSETGEMDHLRVSDTKRSIEVDTQAAMLSVPRKFVVNDDMSIISTLGDMLGFKGAQTLERDFHIMLLTAANWVIDTDRFQGTGTAFSYSAMQQVYDVFANLLDAEGMPVVGGIKTLVVQAGKMFLDAKDLNKSEKVMVRSDNTIDRTESNVFQGTLNNVVETPWFKHRSMNTSTLSLASDKVWMAFADPKIAAAFGVCFLSGSNRKPIIETAPAEFNSLGLRLRVVYDYGLGRIAETGAVRMDGQAPA